MSVYGLQLLEKQKIRTHYGLLERQMRKTFQKAQRMGGVTGTNLLMLLESRLDSVIYRLGFARSLPQARQLVVHGHFLVDGKKVNIPSFQVKPGMAIKVAENSQKIPGIIEGVQNSPMSLPGYLEHAPDSFEAKMISSPNLENIPFTADVAAIIGFYSR